MTTSPPSDPRPRVAAYAVAAREGAILLTRLSEGSAIFSPGDWHLPGGGIDPGEQPTEALARELREETGLAMTEARLLDARVKVPSGSASGSG